MLKIVLKQKTKKKIKLWPRDNNKSSRSFSYGREFFCDVVLPVHLLIFVEINSFRKLQRRLASVLLLIKFFI